jgi:hypothetical protein
MKIKYIIAAFAVLTGLNSCSDFLEETPYNKVTQGNYYTTADGIKGGVNGLYGRLRHLYNTESYMNICEAGTDIDIWPSAAGRQPVNATTGYVRDMWNVCYININQCNEVIYALENNNIKGLTETLKNRYLGEAKFIRALMFSHLVKQWGDIHMELTPTTGVMTTAKRVPEAQVWEQIIKDYRFAINNLPESYDAATEYGRITKYAAEHELSKSLLTCYRTNVDSLKSALACAEDVINSGKYSLVPSTWDLWDMNKMRNSEVILPVCYSQDYLLNGGAGGGNQCHLYFVSDYTQHKGISKCLEYGRPWIRVKPTRYAYELYLNPKIDDYSKNQIVDKRAKDWFMTAWNINKPTYTETLFNPVTKKNEVVTRTSGQLAMMACPWFNMDAAGDAAAEYAKKYWPVWVWVPDHMEAVVKAEGGIQSASNPNGKWPSNIKFCKILFYPYIRKHLDPNRLDFNEAEGSRDAIVSRLGETYLLAAEAAFLLGDKQKAADYINVVRKRAERSEPQFKDKMLITKDQVTADFILDERGRELIGEMQRWYDLKRFGKLTERMTKLHDKIWYQEPAYQFEEYMEKRPYPRDFLMTISNPDDFKNDERYGN